MKAVELIKYIAGIDFIQKQLQKEKSLEVKSTGRSDVVPVECDLETMAKIGGIRVVTLVSYPVVLISRVTGVNYLYQRLRDAYRGRNRFEF